MALKVYWTDFAKNELKSIFDYHREKASLAIAQRIALKIVAETQRLKLHPQIGSREELLRHRAQEFRYIYVETTKSFIGLMKIKRE